MTGSNYNKFIDLRKKFQEFIFESFDYSIEEDKLTIKFHFILNNTYHFYPKLTYFVNSKLYSGNLPDKLLKNAVFNIGMIELVSYWKATCSPIIHIKPYKLNNNQIAFWKKIYFNGLGEFLYTNKIQIRQEELFDFTFSNESSPTPSAESIKTDNSNIIPIGGGKDSIVTLELLKNSNNIALVVNQRGATREVLNTANFNEDNILEIERKIDPMLITLNDMGFLNGHTPFSALLAFICSFAAIITNKKNIALSNEASANEATIPGTKINHQYSKSFEFEQDFRSYYNKQVTASINYYSFLRPLNELQIAAIFSELKDYHKAFKSCNVGSKSDIWCCNCSKCLFTYIILAPFIKNDELVNIFGENLFENEMLKTYLEQLTAHADEKPFECVGTTDEVNAALNFIVDNYDKALPVLLKHYKNEISPNTPIKKDIKDFLSEFDKHHFLDKDKETLIREAIVGLGLKI